MANGNWELRIRTELRDRDSILVSVQDSGPGIEPKQLDSIFGTFVSTKSQGIGLGLAICRMIIERHGGQLSALRGAIPIRFAYRWKGERFRKLTSLGGLPPINLLQLGDAQSGFVRSAGSEPMTNVNDLLGFRTHRRFFRRGHL